MSDILDEIKGVRAELLLKEKELKKELEHKEFQESCDESALQIRALFDGFVKAGFSNEEAYDLTSKLLTAQFNPSK